MLSLVAGGSTYAREGDQFDPLGFPGDDRVITEDVLAHGSQSASMLESNSTGMSDTSETSGIVLRVQFFATTDPAAARDVKARAEEVLTDSVLLTFETPYYKLRTGRFADYDSAEAVAVRLRAMGYESAWVVRVQDHSLSDDQE